tara:strand:- start:5464 stop:6324 length:861 start_codon:yes stop_codon:yes gene_type:complete
MLSSCEKGIPTGPTPTGGSSWNPPPPVEDFELPDIDLTNWKVTLPIPRSDGKPVEVTPPEILDYATDPVLKPFMYNDSSDGSLVFYTYPGASTNNSSYSRTELREQMVSGSNNVNWTFAQGGEIHGLLSVPEISQEADGDYHRTIIMQIHGRLTDQQRDLIDEDDNNAPPVLKIYWRNNKVYVLTKELKDTTDTYVESLETDAWTDGNGRYFSRVVGTDTFSLDVIASDGRLEVTLGGSETFVYDDVHMERWGVFENYFKAGNYLGTLDNDAFAKVKYYSLEVSHD